MLEPASSSTHRDGGFHLAPPSRARDDGDGNILPLINVVFLLLIFFMIAGKLIAEPPFSVIPPETRHADAPALSSAYLAIGARGELAWAGEAIDRQALPQAIAEHPKDQPLQVRADLNLPTGTLNDLLATLRDAGIGRIQLLAQHRS
jgi:biopolymer transport protein ExbD